MSIRANQKIVIVTSDDRHGWNLSNKPPMEPIRPGQPVNFTIEIQWPTCHVIRFVVCATMVELGVHPLAPPRVATPEELYGIGELYGKGIGTCLDWRIDKISIDGIDALDAPRPARDFSSEASDPLVVFPDGTKFVVDATNTSELPAYFYGKFIVAKRGSALAS